MGNGEFSLNHFHEYMGRVCDSLTTFTCTEIRGPESGRWFAIGIESLRIEVHSRENGRRFRAQVMDPFGYEAPNFFYFGDETFYVFAAMNTYFREHL